MTFLNYDFFVNGMLAALLLSLTVPVFSFFIVSRKMSFFPVGISHSAFGGIALALLAGIHPFVGGGIFAVLMALLLTWFEIRKREDLNTLLGIIFPLSMAVGIIGISINDKLTVNVFSYLFGNILSISGADLIMYSVIFLVSVLWFLFFFNGLVFDTFDSESAAVRCVNVNVVKLGFNIVLALIILASVKLLGIILVSAIFLLPGGIMRDTGMNYKRGIPIIMILTLLVMEGGLFLSYYIDVSSGPVIIILYSLVYFAVKIFSKGG